MVESRCTAQFKISSNTIQALWGATKAGSFWHAFFADWAYFFCSCAPGFACFIRIVLSLATDLMRLHASSGSCMSLLIEGRSSLLVASRMTRSWWVKFLLSLQIRHLSHINIRCRHGVGSSMERLHFSVYFWQFKNQSYILVTRSFFN